MEEESRLPIPKIELDQEKNIKDFKKFVELAEDKTVITLLEKLVSTDAELLEFITEYPSVVYTKEMVRLTTYITQYIETYNIDITDPTDSMGIAVIKEMCHQFMLKMTSHKRRRSTELVNGASRQESEGAIVEHRGLKRFLGLK